MPGASRGLADSYAYAVLPIRRLGFEGIVWQLWHAEAQMFGSIGPRRIGKVSLGVGASINASLAVIAPAKANVADKAEVDAILPTTPMQKGKLT
jgi:hypothetical protein